MGESPASLFIKRHMRKKLYFLVQSIAKFVHDKQRARKFKTKVKDFEINQKVA